MSGIKIGIPVGFFTYVPSVILSIQEKYYGIALLSTFLYLFCIFFALFKKINYFLRAVSGSLLFFMVGVILLFTLGPKGAGEIWMFSTTILAALLLGNKGALYGFILNAATLLLVYVLLKTGIMEWTDRFEISAAVWGIKAINFILINFVVVIANAIFIRGFRTLISRSAETRNASIIGLAKLAEYRDTETGNHLKRIQHYTMLLAEELAKTPKYENYITAEYIEDLYISSILHDIGKVGIHDAILLKPGPLTEQEFEKIKHHTEIGSDVITEIEKNIKDRSFYTLGKEIALYHHEKWDGSGYPAGLKEEQIPLSARITALADVYDAITSKRPYKPTVSHEKAMAIIAQGDGIHFDPDIVDVFIKISSRFLGKSSIVIDPVYP